MNLSDLRVLFLGNCADPETSLGGPGVTAIKLRYHKEIYQILCELCGEVIGTNNPKDLYERHGDYDYVFSLFNRLGIKSAEIYPSAVCEYLKVPYLGTEPDKRGIAENKKLFKIVAASCGIPVAKSVSFNPGDKLTEPANLSAPFFVKPESGANSEWIQPSSYCKDWRTAKERIELLNSKKLNVLVEEFVDGVNLAVPVLGGEEPQVLGVIEVPTNEEFNLLTSREKLQDHDVSEFENPRIAKIVKQHAKRLYSVLSPIDYFRIDYRYDDKTDKLVVLEINVCCDINSFGSFVFAAKNNGLSQKGLVRKILEISLNRQRDLLEHVRRDDI